MTREPRARSDVELLRDARAGDRAAFGQLYRRHRPAALRLARSYGGRDEADDLVNGAFEQVMAAVLRGAGPEGPLRPYLFVALRRLAMRRRGPGRCEPLDVLPDSAIAARDLPALDAAERSLVTEAFLDLPDRWQAVLWQVAVEGRPPREVARGTGMSPNAVAALAYRARERLRQTYIQAHVGTGSGRCASHREELGRYVRGTLHHRRRTELDTHLEECATCARLLAELDDVNRLLTRAVLPLFLVDPGAPSLAGAATLSTAGTGTTAGAAAGTTAETAAGATAAASSGVAVPASAALVGAGTGALGLGVVAKATAVAVLVAGVAAVTVPNAHPQDPGHDVEVEASPAPRATPTVDPPPPRLASPPTSADGPPATEPPATSVPDPAADAEAPADGAGTNPEGASTDPGGASPAAPALPGASGPGLDASITVDSRAGLQVDAALDVAPQTGLGVDASVEVAPRSGVEVDASIDVASGTGVDAGVATGPETGVDVSASWDAGPLGTGTLDIGLLDPDGSLVDAEIVVDAGLLGAGGQDRVSRSGRR